MDPVFAQSKDNAFESKLQQMENQMKKMMERMQIDTSGMESIKIDTSFSNSFGFMNDGNGWQPLGSDMDSTKMDNLFSDLWKNFQGRGFDNKIENLMDMFKNQPFFDQFDGPQFKKEDDALEKMKPLETPKKKKYPTKSL